MFTNRVSREASATRRRFAGMGGERERECFEILGYKTNILFPKNRKSQCSF